MEILFQFRLNERSNRCYSGRLAFYNEFSESAIFFKGLPVLVTCANKRIKNRRVEISVVSFLQNLYALYVVVCLYRQLKVWRNSVWPFNHLPHDSKIHAHSLNGNLPFNQVIHDYVSCTNLA